MVFSPLFASTLKNPDAYSYLPMCYKSFSDTVMKKESSLASLYQRTGGPVLKMRGRTHAIFAA